MMQANGAGTARGPREPAPARFDGYGMVSALNYPSKVRQTSADEDV
jgi:hypothetical protein